eukprot:gb/GEZN01010322.1/.p1 GENE.gb/GEZN01010322.1/~~gb/GEZN01010322.1/.p1  ORF type:complete len:294 (+),score=28.60 gb/GEZN01010322.1/:130-1011(+)
MNSISHEDHVWYFSFGSNMNPKVFGPAGRSSRRILYKEATPCRVVGWELRFNLMALPFVEPGMGNIVPSPSSICHGIAYLITVEELQQVYKSEGGKEGSYRLIKLSAAAYDGRTLEVHVCVAPADGQRCHPTLNTCSARYLSLLSSGAAHFQLESSYQTWLKRQRSVNAPVTVKLAVGIVTVQAVLPIMLVYLPARLFSKLLGFECRPTLVFSLTSRLLWTLFFERILSSALVLSSIGGALLWKSAGPFWVAVVMCLDAALLLFLRGYEALYPGSSGPSACEIFCPEQQQLLD